MQKSGTVPGHERKSKAAREKAEKAGQSFDLLLAFGA